jgi:hypothetical protein
VDTATIQPGQLQIDPPLPDLLANKPFRRCETNRISEEGRDDERRRADAPEIAGVLRQNRRTTP